MISSKNFPSTTDAAWRWRTAATKWDSQGSDVHSQRAATLKRLSSSLSSIEKVDKYELTSAELSTLRGAVALLDSLVTLHTKARSTCAREEAARDKRLERAKQAIKSTFGALESAEDKVALISSEQGYLPRTENLPHWEVQRTLLPGHGEFGKALEKVARRVADASVSVPVEVAAQSAWECFNGGAPALHIAHASLIEQIKKALASEAATSASDS